LALRERRLRADAAELSRLADATQRVRIVEAEGDPPERYVLEYQVDGLVVQGGEVRTASHHRVEIFLTLAYPRQAPQCRMLTPIFHPNIAPHAVCIGDHWSAGESLLALVVRLAEMITLQSYNVKSPLNGDAARWVEEHASSLPLTRYDFGRLLADASDGPPIVAAPAPAPEAAVETETSPPPPPGSSDAGGPGPGAAGGPVLGSCPTCGAEVSIPSRWAGPWARCPLCGRMIELPRR
jgi:ubiquitin-protein ligase